jgi:hypothetical protein
VGDLMDLDEEMILTLHEVYRDNWTRLEDLIGLSIQVADRGNRLLEAIAGVKKGDRSKPIELPRPKGRRSEAKKSPREGFRRLMSKQRA